jgi:predicted nucleic acid-binding protein
MTFVDTGAWAALFVPADPLHVSAQGWLLENRDRLVTTDYIVDEVLTLIQTRFSVQVAIRAGQSLFDERLSSLVHVTPEDLDRAWKVFRTHADKRWSFTDCTSLATMERLKIGKAFAYDKHFTQMRGIRRVPD